MVWMGQEGITSPAGVLSFKIDDGADPVEKANCSSSRLNPPSQSPQWRGPKEAQGLLGAGFSDSVQPVRPFSSATSSRKPALVSLAGWGTSLAPGAASPCRHHLSLGGLSPWRLGTVCGPWLCVRWGALHGSGSWLSV